MNPRRVLLVLFLMLSAGLTAWVVLFFVDTREEYERLHAMEVRNRLRLEEAEAQLQKQETILHRLRTDPAYVDKVIRQKLGYAKPDEWIFRFEE